MNKRQFHSKVHSLARVALTWKYRTQYRVFYNRLRKTYTHNIAQSKAKTELVNAHYIEYQTILTGYKEQYIKEVTD